MKNISEALESFREKQSEFYDYWPEEREFDIHWDIIESFLKSTLISLLDEVVPDVTGYAVMSGKIDDEDAPGYESCRKELIKKINEVKQ